MGNRNATRLIILVVLVLGITALHYLTALHLAQAHDVYRRLYYVPIVLGGIWFCLRGGIATSIGVSILYAPHVVFQWGHHPVSAPEQYLEILLYNVIGFLTGFLSQREKEQKNRYMETATNLEKSYAQLKNQADLIFEIEEQLRRADRLSALGELSAGMAHEIRNPLASIRGTAEILRDGIDPADRRYEFAGILIKEVDRLNRVVQDFLDFARPAPADKTTVDTVAILEDVLALTRQQAVKKGVEIRLDARRIPPLPGNGEQLKQAFLNLVLNALQSMPGGGVLTVTTLSAEGEILISFRDTGNGIAVENLDRIFNPFFTTRSEGTGLGLAITHRIVQGHGGRIDVESAPGKGTTFSLAFPCAAASRDAENATETSDRKGNSP